MPYLPEPDPSSYDDDSLPWRDGPAAPDPRNRLTHLVLVDGRLVDVWSERVERTRWSRVAERFDVERRPLPPPTPPTPVHVEVRRWLARVCGGEAALDELGTAPLQATRLDPGLGDLEDAVRELEPLLARVAEQCFDAEVGVALANALRLVLRHDPDLVRRAPSARHLAGAVCWAVGKANALFDPPGNTTQRAVRDVLVLGSAISGCCPGVKRALNAYLDDARRPYAPGVMDLPDLLALGRVELLTSATRRTVLDLRDRAAAAGRLEPWREQ